MVLNANLRLSHEKSSYFGKKLLERQQNFPIINDLTIILPIYMQVICQKPVIFDKKQSPKNRYITKKLYKNLYI